LKLRDLTNIKLPSWQQKLRGEIFFIFFLLIFFYSNVFSYYKVWVFFHRNLSSNQINNFLKSQKIKTTYISYNLKIASCFLNKDNLKRLKEYKNFITGFSLVKSYRFDNIVPLKKSFSYNLEVDEKNLWREKFSSQFYYQYKFGGIISFLNYFDLDTLKKVKIGVIDAGFFSDNKSFSKINIKEVKNLTPEGLDEDVSGASHGTLVTSLIGGYSPYQIYTSGIGCDFYLVKTEVNKYERIIEEDFLLHGIEYLADTIGIDVINISLGYNIFDDTTQHDIQQLTGDSLVLEKAINYYFYNKGIIFTIAAGNEYTSDWKYIIVPADAKEAISVGSVNSDSIHSLFSSVGISENNIKPNVVYLGENVSGFNGTNDNSYIETASGTSLASPLVLNYIILAKRLLNLSPFEIKDKLYRTSSNWNNPNLVYGYGIPNAFKLLNDSSNIFGFVLDKDTKNPLYGVKIKYNNREILSSSDGFFYIGDLSEKNISIKLSYPGFYDTTYVLSTLSFDSLLLRKKMNTLTLYLYYNQNTPLLTYAKIKYLDDNNNTIDSSYSLNDFSFFIPEKFSKIKIEYNDPLTHSVITKVISKDTLYNGKKIFLMQNIKIITFLNNLNNPIDNMDVSIISGKKIINLKTDQNGKVIILYDDINSFNFSVKTNSNIYENIIVNMSFSSEDTTIFLNIKPYIYPNPAIGDQNIYIRSEDNDEIFIVNSNGRILDLNLVYNPIEKSFILNSFDLSSGVYYIIIKRGEKKFRKKILVIK